MRGTARTRSTLAICIGVFLALGNRTVVSRNRSVNTRSQGSRVVFLVRWGPAPARTRQSNENIMQRAVAPEVIDDDTLLRLDAEVRAALKRKPAHELRLAGALRELARYSERLQGSLSEAFETTVRRSSFERPLYAALARALAELGDERAIAALCKALETDEAGGLAGISAAALCRAKALCDPLAK